MNDRNGNASIQEQNDLTQAFADANDIEIQGFYSDVKSGTTEAGLASNERSGLYEALNAVEQGLSDGILVLEDSRIARSVSISMSIRDRLVRSGKGYTSVSEPELYVYFL